MSITPKEFSVDVKKNFKNKDKFYYRGPTLAGKPSQVKWPDQVNPPTETDPEPEP